MRTKSPFETFVVAGAGMAGLAGLSEPALAQDAPQAQGGQELEEVVVTGFRRSLTDATTAKRESVGFVDSIFAEDIGKFPDLNLAESFNRIPGVNITREITGEGLNVAIRGLNTNFTRVLLNNAPVAIAAVRGEIDMLSHPPSLLGFKATPVAKPLRLPLAVHRRNVIRDLDANGAMPRAGIREFCRVPAKALAKILKGDEFYRDADGCWDLKKNRKRKKKEPGGHAVFSPN